MGIDRRKFFKVSGLTALGLAGGSVSKVFSRETPYGDSVRTRTWGTEPPKGPLTAQRWAMVIDLRKCHEQPDCNDCVNACHRTHNVPKWENPKDEVKWIWKESFEHAFHDQEHSYQQESLKHLPALVVQPLRQPSLRARLSNGGDVETREGRHCHDGLASLHRLSLLRGCLSLWFAQFQLA